MTLDAERVREAAAAVEDAIHAKRAGEPVGLRDSEWTTVLASLDYALAAMEAEKALNHASEFLTHTVAYATVTDTLATLRKARGVE